MNKISKSLYFFFALLAVLANLVVQRILLLLGDDTWIYSLAIVSGTIIGLSIKYALDKRWVFRDEKKGLIANSKQFSLYTLMGGVTTGIFWGMETLFWLAWNTHFMRELGAVLGLSIGYIVKFQLDRRFVFRNS